MSTSAAATAERLGDAPRQDPRQREREFWLGLLAIWLVAITTMTYVLVAWMPRFLPEVWAPGKSEPCMFACWLPGSPPAPQWAPGMEPMCAPGNGPSETCR